MTSSWRTRICRRVSSFPSWTSLRSDTTSLAQGDELPFDRADALPQAGHEQRGRRPALILSPRPYSAKARFAIACPITSHVKGYPFEVELPTAGSIAGVVLADHVKNLDWEARRVVFEAKAPSEVLVEGQGAPESIARVVAGSERAEGG